MDQDKTDYLQESIRLSELLSPTENAKVYALIAIAQELRKINHNLVAIYLQDEYSESIDLYKIKE